MKYLKKINEFFYPTPGKSLGYCPKCDNIVKETDAYSGKYQCTKCDDVGECCDLSPLEDGDKIGCCEQCSSDICTGDVYDGSYFCQNCENNGKEHALRQ